MISYLLRKEGAGSPVISRSLGERGIVIDCRGGGEVRVKGGRDGTSHASREQCVMAGKAVRCM